MGWVLLAKRGDAVPKKRHKYNPRTVDRREERFEREAGYRESWYHICGSQIRVALPLVTRVCPLCGTLQPCPSQAMLSHLLLILLLRLSVDANIGMLLSGRRVRSAYR